MRWYDIRKSPYKLSLNCMKHARADSISETVVFSTMAEQTEIPVSGVRRRDNGVRAFPTAKISAIAATAIDGLPPHRAFSLLAEVGGLN